MNKETEKRIKGVKKKQPQRPKRSATTAKKSNVGLAIMDRPWAQPLKKLIDHPLFGRLYEGLAVAVLLSTSIYWSYISNHVHMLNADQLVDPYFFENASTFKHTLFPPAHTYLLKWPLFYLVHLFGNTATSYAILTIGSVLATLVIFVWFLYRIEHRPLVFGTLCLALASSLLLVPAQPYAGALLPLNMAMLATRNLEYVLYVVCVAELIRSRNIRRKSFWVACIGLVLLVASDKLFLGIGIGAYLLGGSYYLYRQRFTRRNTIIGWVGVIAGVSIAGSALLVALNALHVTTISDGSSASPYPIIRSVQNAVLGSLYAVLHYFSNFGANPAFDATVVKHIPTTFQKRIFEIGGPAYAINAIFVAWASFVAVKITLGSVPKRLAHHAKTYVPTDVYIGVTAALTWSTVAALGIFIITDHYYAVDGRYLTIAVFALFIAAATYARRLAWKHESYVGIGIVLIIGIACGLQTTMHINSQQNAALNTIRQRNSLIAQALANHPVTTLVGDYWRVIPIKNDTDGKQKVTPLQDCTKTRPSLTSTDWNPDLTKNSFAYLISHDQKLTDFPDCSIDTIVAAYGRPNASVTIAGNLDNPFEQVLFYDRGANKSAPTNVGGATTATPATVLPIDITQLPFRSCPNGGKTTLNIVAHEDDDLLFMNPDIQNDLANGGCTRTVYITAGDAGGDQFYWLGREKGSQAAYSVMTPESDDIWVERIVKLGEKQYMGVANPRGNAHVSLISLRLPDGNLRGQGFRASHFENIERLEDGEIGAIHSVDRQSTFTLDQLVDDLTSIIRFYQPSEVRTQSTIQGGTFVDHSDHMAVGRLAIRAYERYVATIPKPADKALPPVVPALVTPTLSIYLGYPVRDKPENVSVTDLQTKESAFYAYGQHDGGVCRDRHGCDDTPTYYAYLRRMYKVQE